MTQDEAKTAIGVMIDDILDQVSDDRLTAAVTEAWEDAWVTSQAKDSSLVFSSGTYDYTLPSTITTVGSVSKINSGNTEPIEISPDLWEVFNGTISFNNKVSHYIGDGDTIVLRGRYKLKSTDPIPSTDNVLKNYVLCMASWVILRGIGFSKILSFLRNDITTNELLAFRQQMEQDMLKYRMQLQTEYQDN